MQPPQSEGRHQPAGSFKALAHALLYVGAEQQGLLSPELQLSAAQPQIFGAAPQQDHTAHAHLKQLLQLGIGELPAGIAALAVAAEAAAAHHQQLRQLAAQFS
jgi:phosphate starvation-inducible protein PhoH